MENKLNVTFENTQNRLKVQIKNDTLSSNIDDKVVVYKKYIEADHTKLDNLDYESSGHIGFMPSRLTLLPSVEKDVSNHRLMLPIYDVGLSRTSNISFDNLKDRIIRSCESMPDDLQKGQYILLEIKKENE